MAADEALMAAPEVPVLRLYHWDQPTASFGYFEKFTEVRRSRPSPPLVRRWTGGGIVDHGADWTYSLIIPAQHPFAGIRVSESYRRIHTAIVAFLQNQGHAAVLSTAVFETGDGCFQRPVVADVIIDGRKIAGGAQRRTRRGLLHQGSIQNIDTAHWTAKAFARPFSRDVTLRELSKSETAEADRLTETRYATDSWLTRF